MELLKASEARDIFKKSGVSVSAWARANELNPMVVYAVLSGRHKGTRGEAHKAAVLLRLKQGPLVPAGSEKDVLSRGAQ